MFKRKKSGENEIKTKLSLSRIVSNNLFVLKKIHKTAPGFTFLLIIMTALEALLDFLLSSYLLRYILNGIADGRSFSELFWFAVICISLFIVMQVAFSFFYQYFYQLKMCDLRRDFCSMVYQKASEVDVECYENPEYYNKFVKSIEECQTRFQSVLRSISNIVFVVVNFSANFGLIIAIDPWLTVFLLLPLICIPLAVINNKIVYKRDLKFQVEGRNMDYCRHSFYLADYAKEMRMIPISGLLLKKFTEASRRFIKIVQKEGFKIAVILYSNDLILEIISPIGATIYSLWKTLSQHTMPYGDCAVVFNSISSMAHSIRNAAWNLLSFQENALYIERLREFLDYQPKISDGTKPLPDEGDIEISNLYFKYEGADNYTLKNISMKIGKREKIAIVGHNGAGKSTLIKLLLRLYDGDSGSITYGGTDIKDLPLSGYRSGFAAVMQDFHIFSIPIAENVLLRPREEGDDETVKTALEKSGLYQKVSGFENGIDTLMTKEFDDKGEVMSGGQQQKLAIAHIYSRKNKFVILDEPSSALDPIAEHDMYEQMYDACSDCGMIFISHRLSAATTADRIYLMENGEIAEYGTHAELMAKNGIYAEMFRHQAENYQNSTADAG